MSLTSCLFKAKDTMHPDDFDAVLARAQALEEGGMATPQAERQAVQEVLDEVQGEVAGKPTDSPAFRAWFKNSKVVEADGQPKVVYHGTFADFDTFKLRTGDIGLHFGSAEAASDRIAIGVPHRKNKAGELDLPANVMPVYLSLQNPLRLKDSGFWNQLNMETELRQLFPDFPHESMSTKSVRQFIQSKGHDGVVYRNTGEVAGAQPFRDRSKAAHAAMRAVFPKRQNSFSPADQQVPEYIAWRQAEDAYRAHRDASQEDSYIAFDAKQVKSALGNNGDFSTKTHNITQSPVRQTDTPAFHQWFGKDSNLLNDDGTPMVLYHGTNRKFKAFKRSATGAMGPGIYLGDDRSVAEAYDGDGRGQQVIMAVFARGKYLDNMAWTDYINQHGWTGAEAAAKADGWAGVHDTKFESAVVVWDPQDIKSADFNSGQFDGSSDNIHHSPARDPRIDTPEFKKWFGDSKVVDAQGKPLVVYHGTSASHDFAAFKTNADGLFGPGAYFTDSTTRAAGYAEKEDDFGRIMPVFLALKNPLLVTGDYDAGEEVDFESPAVPMLRQLFGDKADAMISRLIHRDGGLGPQVRRRIEALGHDGIIVQWEDNKDYIAFDPTQIKSAISNNGNFDGKAKDITRSPTRSAMGFYSSLATGVDAMATKQAPAGAWKTQIKGLVNKGLVKAEEVEWSGINDWLDLQDGKVGKDAVMGYLDANGVQVQETTLGEGDWAVYDGDDNQYFSSQSEAVAYAKEMDIHVTEDTVFRATDRPGGYGTKYETYTLPGGENYREVLLTLPEKSGIPLREALEAKYGLQGKSLWNAATPEERAMVDKEASGMKVAGQHGYKSSHWDQQNVLAHLRLNDRTDADGAKVLFVEEIQSDWGQDGKKKGFGKTYAPGPGWTATYRKENDAWMVIAPDGLQSSFLARGISSESEAIAEAAKNLTKFGVPVAPFVNKTDGWLTLALKRVMVLAAEGGYDKVAFVNGKQSAERYDLSQSVKIIDYSVTGDQNYHVEAFTHDGQVLPIPYSLDADGIEKYIGKELAKKIIDTATRTKQSITGDNLKVGGEGMKTFYNAIVPNAAKALLKKMGGGVMEDVRFNNAEVTQVGRSFQVEIDGEVKKFSSYQNALEYLNKFGSGLSQQPGFTITHAMREVVAAGVPLFSPARAPETPMFSSPLSTAIEGVPDRLATMAAPQWKLWLDANAAKLGVKKDEIEWSGIKDYLTLRGKDKVTRDEVAGYLQVNGVQLGETVLGHETQDIATQKWLDEAAQSYFSKSFDALAAEDQDWLRGKADDANITPTTQSKYQNYTLPGGENYREILVTLPARGGVIYTADNVEPISAQDDPAANKPELFWYFKVPGNLLQIPKSKHATEAAAKAYIIKDKQPEAPAAKNFTSGHWTPKNILVHLRVDDRVDADGKKVLLVNEIQSDWGQQGKKQGFQKPDMADDQVHALLDAAGLQAEHNQHNWVVTAKDGGPVPNKLAGGSDKNQFAANLAQVAQMVLGRRDLMASHNAVPNGPFVGDTKSWVGLGLKRAIIMAVDGGYDRVALITGQQAADFYDLSKQISRVVYDPQTEMLNAFDNSNQSVLMKSGVKPEQVEDYIGKEPATRLFKQKNIKTDYRGGKEVTYHEITDEDLKVGGEGMQAFYDQIAPQVTRELLKKMGGGAMTTSTFTHDPNPALDQWEPESGERDGSRAEVAVFKQPAFDITDALRDKVVAGVPLFSPARDAGNRGTNHVMDNHQSPEHSAEEVLQAMELDIISDDELHDYNENRFQGGALNPKAHIEKLNWEEYSGMMKRSFYIQDPSGESRGLLRTAWYYPQGVSGGTGNPVMVVEDENGQEILLREVEKESIRRSPIRDAINQRGSHIVGQTNRVHTAEQLAHMKEVGFQVETPSLKERFQALTQNLGKRLAQGLVDQFAPIKDLSQHAYLLTRLSKGASGAFESFLRGGKLKLVDGVYDFDDKHKGGVVDKLLIPMGGEHHDFFRWVAANRAERLLGEGKENLFTEENIRVLKTLADGGLSFSYTLQHGPHAGQVTRNRRAMYDDSLITFNAFNKNIMDLAEQSGLIDGDARHLWEQEFYVPFYRVADEVDGGVRGMGAKGSMVRQQAFKKLKGGKNALNADLLDNTLMNWAHLLDASAKNRAAKATLEAAVNLGVAVEADQETVRQMGKDAKSAPVWFMDAGKQRHFVVEDPMLLTAISSLEYAGMRNPVMNAMGTMKHVLTVGVTASPFFKVRNLIRDSVQVIGTGPIRYNPAGNVAQGWALTDPKSDAYFHLLAGGGTIHFGTMLEGSEAKRVQALVESGVDAATILDSEGKVKAFFRHYIEPTLTAYNELGNRGEAVNRAALYDQLVKKGMSHAEASLAARDLMDFSMQGSFTSVRFLTQVVPFLNARMVGMYKLGRAVHEDPRRMAIVAGAVTLASLALLAAYGDDEDWKKRTEDDRNNFWWFKLGGKAFRIPKPFELGAVGTLAERGFEFMFDKEMTGKRLRSQVLALLSDNLAMNPVPQAFKPLIDIYANKDSFSGRPIETMGMERLKSEYRFNDRTTMTARATSTALNAVTGLVGQEAFSPVQIDAMLRGYFGWLGAFVVGSAEVMARPMTSQPAQARADFWKLATGNMVSDLRDAPSRYVNQMYEQSQEIEKAYATHRMLLKEGKTEDAAEFKQEHQAELNQYRSIESVKKSAARINAQRREIERSAMTPEEKREALRVLSAQQDAIAKKLRN